MYWQKFFWRLMFYAAAHFLVGWTTFLLPEIQGDDVECCLVNFAVQICRRLVLQFDPMEQIFCALHFCGQRRPLAFYLFSKAGYTFSSGQVSLYLAGLHLVFFFCGVHYRHCVSSSAMMEQQNMSSLLAVSKGRHKFQNDPPFALHLDCALRVWHSVFSCQDPS